MRGRKPGIQGKGKVKFKNIEAEAHQYEEYWNYSPRIIKMYCTAPIDKYDEFLNIIVKPPFKFTTTNNITLDVEVEKMMILSPHDDSFTFQLALQVCEDNVE